MLARGGSLALKNPAKGTKLDELLWNWARFMFSSGNPQFTVASRSVGQGYTHTDTDAAYDALDARLYKAVDAAVNDLPERERAVIYTVYLGQRWRWSTQEANAALSSALSMLKASLLKRHIVVD
jgi:DNA-directed RNA polymerase specialized sigma24 family protein